MDNYYYLYKNLTNAWNTATNPVFIAKHTYCRAVPKEVITDLGYDLVSDFVHDLNKEDYVNKEFNNIVLEWELF